MVGLPEGLRLALCETICLKIMSRSCLHGHFNLVNSFVLIFNMKEKCKQDARIFFIWLFFRLTGRAERSWSEWQRKRVEWEHRIEGVVWWSGGVVWSDIQLPSTLTQAGDLFLVSAWKLVIKISSHFLFASLSGQYSSQCTSSSSDFMTGT